MIHYGKNPDGDLEIRVTGDDIPAMKRVIDAAPLEERRVFFNLKNYVEQEFKDALKKKGGRHAVM